MNIVKKATIALTAAFALVFIGCGSSLVVTDKSVPEEKSATLYLAGESRTLDKVDGKPAKKFLGLIPDGAKGTKTASFDNAIMKKELQPTAQIPAGERKITVSAPGAVLGKNTKDSTYTFEAGKKYRIAMELLSASDIVKGEQLTITEIVGEIPKE